MTDTPAVAVSSAPEEKPHAPQGAGAAIAAALLAVVGAAVSVTAPLWSHEYLQRSVNVAVIEKRTADTEAALGVASTQRADLSSRLETVEKSLASLETRVARAPAVVGALAARDLRAALATGAPFTAEVVAVRAAGLIGAEDDALLAVLAPYSEKGVPTAGALNEEFAWVASSILGARLTSMLPSLPSDISARMWDWANVVAGAVSDAAVSVTDAAASVNVSAVAQALRLAEPGETLFAAAAPVSDAAPAPAPTPAPAAETAPAAPAVDTEQAAIAAAAALVTEAGDLLRQGNLAGAVSAMEQLEGRAATLSADWLAGAKARLTADKTGLVVAERAVKALQ